MNQALRGTGVALVTPFHNDGSVDFKGYRKLVDNLIENKVDYLVPMGTTGESVTLTKSEKQAIFDCTLEVNDGRVPVVAGIGGNNTSELCDYLNHFDPAGFSAILSVSPYYNKPSQEGLFQHYKALAENAPLPIILYNVPGRTGANMTAQTTLRIASSVKNVIGIKEASGNFEQFMQILKNKPKDFLVISGDDGITLPFIALGGDGVISVVGNAFPADFANLTRFALAGDYENARKLHYKLIDIINLLFVEGSPAGIKAALKIKGICEDKVRLPLANISAATFKSLKEAIEKY